MQIMAIAIPISRFPIGTLELSISSSSLECEIPLHAQFVLFVHPLSTNCTFLLLVTVGSALPQHFAFALAPPGAQQISDNDTKRNAYGQPLSATFRPHRKSRSDQRCNIGVRLHGRTPRAFQTQKAMMGAMCHRKKVRILELFRGHFGPPPNRLHPSYCSE